MESRGLGGEINFYNYLDRHFVSQKPASSSIWAEPGRERARSYQQAIDRSQILVFLKIGVKTGDQRACTIDAGPRIAILAARLGATPYYVLAGRDFNDQISANAN